MNRFYRVVRNATTGAWVVASELATGRGRGKTSAVVGSATLAIAGAFGLPSTALADDINSDIIISGAGGGTQPNPWNVPSFRLGYQAGSSANMTITDGGTVTSPNYGYVAYGANSASAVSVTGAGSTWNSGAVNLGVGTDSTGSLSIADQGTVNTGFVTVGTGAGSTGAVSVSGPGSALNIHGDLWVGMYQANGTLNIEDGGAMSSTRASVAMGANSQSSVLVTGSNSTWTNTGILEVGLGNDSEGSLYVLDGGKVTTRELQLANNANGVSNGSAGNVVVDGAGSELTSSGQLTVGGSGVGRMTISNAGTVNSGHSSIASSGPEGSLVHVTGNGSVWNTAALTVGDYSNDHPTSTLRVDDGGHVVSNEYATLHNAGAVTITGTNSTWSTGAGLQSNGFMAITNGGELQSSLDPNKASEGNRIGTGSLNRGDNTPLAIVAGADARWLVGHGDLYVGDGMVGDLVVANGGEVFVTPDATSHVGHAHEKYGDASGRVNVTGAGSTWHSGHLEIGSGNVDMFDNDVTYAGQGDVLITNGGTVISSSVALGTEQAGSQGKLVVRGAGSIFDNNGAMQVGVVGEGTVTVADGARVRSAGDVVLAQGAGSTGTLNIGAGGAAGTLDAAQVIGGDGAATVNFDHTDSADFGAAMSGKLTVNKFNAGTTRLLSASDYAGVTTVEGGTLQAGVAGAFSGNSTFKVAPTAALDMGGFNQTIASLDNAGTVAFASTSPPAARMAPVGGTTLTVTGDYVGNGGMLVMNTVLGGDDSVSDKLVVGGSTSGATFVQVKNAGGAGAATDNGIELINVAGASNGTFALQGRAVAGLYDYQLYQGGKTTPDDGNWYLRSEAEPTAPGNPGGPEHPGTPEVPGTPEIPGTPGKPGKPTLRPEPGAYLGNQNAALRMFQHTMHDRVGEPGLTARQEDGEGYATWMRVQTSKLDSGKIGGQVDVDTHTTVMQLGVEKQFDVGTGRLHAGVMGGYGRATTDAKSHITDHKARGVVNGKNIGVYGTWFQNAAGPEGAYVDTWLQYGDFDNSVKGDHLGSETYKSRTWSASVEAGYAFKVHQGERYGVYLEPQAQVIHTDYRSDDVREDNGTRVQSGKAGGTTTRLGARVYARSLDSSTNRIQPFAEVNWWSGGNQSSIAMDGERVSHDLPKNILETKVGAQFEIGRGWSGYGSVGYQQGSNSFSDIGGQLGVKFSF